MISSRRWSIAKDDGEAFLLDGFQLIRAATGVNGFVLIPLDSPV